MPCSNGLYSPPDAPEPSLSDLFGSTTSDSSMGSVVEGVARARMDDDSIETETDSVHIGSDGTVTSMPVGLDSTISSISQMFSFYTDCLPVSCKNRFWTGTGECRMEYAAASSANGLGFSPAGAVSSDVYGSAPNTRYYCIKCGMEIVSIKLHHKIHCGGRCMLSSNAKCTKVS